MVLGRGENIGEAFVRIVYSGEGAHLSKDIRDDLERDTPAFEAIGEEHSAAYEKGFQKQTKRDKDVTFESLQKALDRGTGKMEASGSKAGDALMAGLEQDLKEKFGEDVGNAMSQSLKDRLRRGGTFKDVEKELSTNLESLVRDATKTVQAGEKRTLADQSEFERKFINAMNVDVKRQEKFTSDFRSSLDKISADSERAWTNGTKAVEDYGFSLDRLRVTNGKTNHDFNILARSIQDASKRFSFFSLASKKNSGSVKKDASDIEGSFNKVDRSIADAANALGAAFGRGSRNNFLNFFGSLIRNGLQLARIPFKIADGFSNLRDSFSETEKTGGASFRALEGEGTSFSEILGAIAIEGPVALALVGAAAGALFFTLGPIIAALSLLLGIVVALAAAVAGALVGAVAVLVAAVAPLVFGLGAVVVGFSAWDKTAKKNSKSLKSLQTDWYALGKQIRSGLFSNLPQQLKLIDDLLKTMGPLLHAAGVGASDFFTAFIRSLQSPGFKEFETVFARALPGLLTSWGQIAGEAFIALGGVLRSLIPLAQEFLGWLAGITQQFADWTNSKSGQASMRKFWREVTTDAKSVARLLKSLGDLIAALFTSGRKTGDNIIDSMAKSIEKFAKFLESPSGRKQLKQWFADARQLATALGNATVEVGKLFSAFDDPATRTVALAFFFGLAKVINGVANGVDAVIRFVHRLGDIIGGFSIDWSKLIPDFSTLHGFNAGQLIKLPNIASLAGHFAGLGAAIRKEIGNINVSGIIHGAAAAVGGLLGTFAGTAGKILSRVSPVNVASIIVGAAAALAKLLDTFAGGAKKILDKVSPVNVSNIFSGLAAAAATLVSWAHSLASIIASIFSGIQIHINWPSPPAWLGKLHLAAGGIVSGPHQALIGEAGPEAVVPLNRPLNMVDPAVRWLSAIAQGKDMPMASGGVVGGGKQVTVTQNIFSPQADPRAVAVETINHLVAVGY